LRAKYPIVRASQLSGSEEKRSNDGGERSNDGSDGLLVRSKRTQATAMLLLDSSPRREPPAGGGATEQQQPRPIPDRSASAVLSSWAAEREEGARTESQERPAFAANNRTVETGTPKESFPLPHPKRSCLVSQSI
jgi:hypothetical protein